MEVELPDNTNPDLTSDLSTQIREMGQKVSKMLLNEIQEVNEDDLIRLSEGLLIVVPSLDRLGLKVQVDQNRFIEDLLIGQFLHDQK